MSRAGSMTLFTVFTIACGSGAPATLEIRSGNTQTAPAGAAVPKPPTVAVLDGSGNGVAGVEVTFTVVTGGGRVDGERVVSNGGGLAFPSAWVLGTRAGENTLEASSGALPPVSFRATAGAGRATKMRVLEGAGQKGDPGTALPIAPRVVVVDAHDNPVVGAVVEFTPGSSGRVLRAKAVTDANGSASSGPWTLGEAPGVQRLMVRTEGVDPLGIEADSTRAVSLVLSAREEGLPSAPAGTGLAIAPSVVLRTREGVGVAGAVVRFRVTLGGGSVVSEQALTDTAGVASPGRWTLGAAAGPQRLEVSSDGASPLALPALGFVDETPAFDRTLVLKAPWRPWDLAWAPGGELLASDRDACAVRVFPPGFTKLSDGKVVIAPRDCRPLGQGGMLGLAVDPDFTSNRYVYTYFSSTAAGPDNRVVRWHVPENWGTAGDRTDLVTGIPWSDNGAHNGGRIRFAADGTLWITTGDTHQGPVPQDLHSLGGKVLRVDRDGRRPPGNPDLGAGADGLIYAYGFRNPQGLAFRPLAGDAFLCEQGPDHDDEVTKLRAGGNGGWRPMFGDDPTYVGYVFSLSMTDSSLPDVMLPTWSTGPSNADGLSGCGFASGSAWKRWDGALFVAFLSGLRGEVLRPNTGGGALASPHEPILPLQFRLRTFAQGPDGAMYVTTDGAGGGDELWKLVPR